MVSDDAAVGALEQKCREEFKRLEKRIDAVNMLANTNKLEAEALALVRSMGGEVRAHALRLELANGVQYTPDIIEVIGPAGDVPGRLRIWEVKGKQVWDDAIVKLKVAKRYWPMFSFLLLWKERGEWQSQEIHE